MSHEFPGLTDEERHYLNMMFFNSSTKREDNVIGNTLLSLFEKISSLLFINRKNK